LNYWQEEISKLELVKPGTLLSETSNHQETISALAELLKQARPLAELVASEEYSPEDRKLLRELTRNGRSNEVFDLSNLLNRLCGERALRSIQQQQAARKVSPHD
jgi:hypothetical protein